MTTAIILTSGIAFAAKILFGKDVKSKAIENEIMKW